MAQREKNPSYMEAPRQASISAPNLASDDDAAVLGEHGRYKIHDWMASDATSQQNLGTSKSCDEISQ